MGQHRYPVGKRTLPPHAHGVASNASLPRVARDALGEENEDALVAREWAESSAGHHESRSPCHSAGARSEQGSPDATAVHVRDDRRRRGARPRSFVSWAEGYAYAQDVRRSGVAYASCLDAPTGHSRPQMSREGASNLVVRLRSRVGPHVILPIPMIVVVVASPCEDPPRSKNGDLVSGAWQYILKEKRERKSSRQRAQR